MSKGIHMNEKEALTQEIQRLETKATNIANSFTELKKNPLNLNFLMTHVMTLSATVDEMLRERAKQLRAQMNALPSEEENVNK